MENQNKTLLIWKAPEFIPYHRGVKWLIAAGVILALLVIYAIYTDSATMAMALIAIAGAYYLTHRQQPKIIDVEINELGIEVDDKFYPYSQINSFWIIYHPPYVQTLYIKLGGKVKKTISIQLGNQNPAELRSFLTKEIPEVEGGEESMMDTLTRLFKL